MQQHTKKSGYIEQLEYTPQKKNKNKKRKTERET